MEYKIGRSQATPVDNAISQACQTMTQAKFVWFTTSIAAFSNEGIFHGCWGNKCK